MKLSEMNSDQLSACLCKIAPALESIGMDEKFSDALKRIADKDKDLKPAQQGAVMIGAFVPMLLGDHKDDTFAVLAALSGKTVKEIREQNGMQTIKEVKEALSDRDLMDFFMQSARTGASE